MSKELLESYEEFKKLRESNEEMPSYDEQDDPPTASIRQEDWLAKDTLQQATYTLSELVAYMEDGEELEEEQQKMVKSIFSTINKLKRQFEERERIVRKEKEEDKK